MTKVNGYTTWGSVRGGCDHVHGTLRTALACLKRDRARCASAYGYSDREIRALVERGLRYDTTRGPGRALADDERAEIAYITEGGAS